MTRGMCDDVEVVVIGSNDDVEPLHPALEGLIWHDSVVIGPVEGQSHPSVRDVLSFANVLMQLEFCNGLTWNSVSDLQVEDGVLRLQFDTESG